MANEWDLDKSKTVPDWDKLFQTLQTADAAHDRERSIHNCAKYYNHSQPWVSHISLQGHDVQQLDMAKAQWTQVRNHSRNLPRNHSRNLPLRL